MPTVLYGAACYHEYMPYERLDQDIALMKAAGFNVVRLGESTWSLWEPEDGRFDYAWMDRIMDAMGKAGIKVIMDTPTYSIPAWLARQHPDILWSRDSLNALNDMPFAKQMQWGAAATRADYSTLVKQLHRALYDLNVGADFVFPDNPDFSAYKLLIVPSLYVADDALLARISDYIRQGGTVRMTFESGFAKHSVAVRWTMAPGPLREALGFHYQEFSNLAQPLMLKDGTGPSSCSSTRKGQGAGLVRPSLLRTLAGDHHQSAWCRQGGVRCAPAPASTTSAAQSATTSTTRQHKSVSATRTRPARTC